MSRSHRKAYHAGKKHGYKKAVHHMMKKSRGGMHSGRGGTYLA